MADYWKVDLEAFTDDELHKITFTTDLPQSSIGHEHEAGTATEAVNVAMGIAKEQGLRVVGVESVTLTNHKLLY